MFEIIRNLDVQLFFTINGWHNIFLDFIMYWASDKFIWIPFYVFLLIYLLKNIGNKIVYVLVAVLLIVIISDQTSVLIKNAVERLRPCHVKMYAPYIHLIKGHCGGKYGFVSSHASNVFSIASFIIMLLQKNNRKLSIILVLWAVLVCYSRVYLGVHYPLDVLGGAVLGIIIGTFFGKLLVKNFLKPIAIKTEEEKLTN